MSGQSVAALADVGGFRRMVDSTDKEIDYLSDRLTALESKMIDPQEFGQLKGEVVAQRRDLDRMATSLGEIAKSMDKIQQQLSEAKGGWKIMLMVGGASATVGALIAKGAVWWAKAGAPGP